MDKDRQPSGRLQATLVEMKRKLEQEREAAELLTRRLTVQREQKSVVTQSRFSPIETELTDARNQLRDQKAVTEKWIEAVTAERDAGRAKLRDADSKIQRLQNQLQSAQKKFQEEKEAAEGLIHQLVNNGAVQGSSEAAERAAALEQQLETLRGELAGHQQAAEERVRALAEERDRLLSQMSSQVSSQEAGRQEAAGGTDSQDDASGARVAVLEQELQNIRSQYAEQARQTDEQIRQLASEREQFQAVAAEAGEKAQAMSQQLAAAQEEFDAEMETAEQQRQQLAAERDQHQARLSETQTQIESLNEHLAAAREEHAAQKESLEVKLAEIAGERDESRALYSEVESRTQQLEKEFMAAHEQFREQRELAEQVIHQMESERENFRRRVDEMEVESVRLQADLTKAQNDLRLEGSKHSITKEVRTEILDAVVDIQVKGQKLLDLLQAWSSKDAEVGLEMETPETISFFERER